MRPRPIFSLPLLGGGRGGGSFSLRMRPWLAPLRLRPRLAVAELLENPQHLVPGGKRPARLALVALDGDHELDLVGAVAGARKVLLIGRFGKSGHGRPPCWGKSKCAVKRPPQRGERERHDRAGGG